MSTSNVRVSSVSQLLMYSVNGMGKIRNKLSIISVNSKINELRKSTSKEGLERSFESDLDLNLNPADFLPYGTDLAENDEVCSENKLIDNMETFSNSVKLSLCIIMIIICASLMYSFISRVLLPVKITTPKDSSDSPTISNKFCVQSLPEKENEAYNELWRLQRTVHKLKKQFELFSKWQEKMKLELRQVRNESSSLVIKHFHELNYKIDETINLYEADKLGETDYALETAGGTIVSVADTVPYPSNKYMTFFGVKVQQLSSDPQTLIRPGNLPGQCFAFSGEKGRIRIHLIQPIRVMSVTMEHVHPKLLTDKRSAPKNFAVYGLEIEKSMYKENLGYFTFSMEGKPLQNFRISNGSKNIFEYVELKILSNYGHPNYTCIYRFRVHGKPKEESTRTY